MSEHDPQHDPIEHDLARLASRLRRPSEALDRRVEAALAQAEHTPPPFRFRVPRFAISAAACLAVAVGAFVVTRATDRPAADSAAAHPSVGVAPADSPAATVVTQPVRFNSTVTGIDAGDVVILDNRLPVVPIRRSAVQTARWIDDESGAEIELTVPRHDMLIVPAHVD